MNPLRRSRLSRRRCSRAGNRIKTIPNVGWDGDAYQLPGTRFTPGGYEETLDDSEHAHYYQSAGSLVGWRADIAAQCQGDPRLTLAICAGFAGPMLEVVGLPAAMFHFVTSDDQASVLLTTAGSVLGGLGRRSFVRSWSESPTAAMLHLHRDATFVLDDFSEMDWGELQTLKGPAWRGIVLSSGKQALSWPEGFTSLQISVVNLPGDPPVSRELLTAAQRDHGWALREFLARLVQEDREEMRSKLDDELINFSLEMEGSDALDHFALLASAGEWATWWGITGWELGTANDALHYCYDWWRESLNGGARHVQYRFRDLEAYQVAHRRSPRSTQNASGDEAV